MIRFLLRRALWFVLTVWVVVSVSFVLMRACAAAVLERARAEPGRSSAALAERYHLDWPLWKQYLQYVGPVNLGATGPRWLGGDGSAPYGGVLSLDLGPSFKYRDFTGQARSWRSRCRSRPRSARWRSAGRSCSGSRAGILSAARRGSALDLGRALLATLGIALPNFVVAGLADPGLLLRPRAGLPPAGWGDLRHMLLPAFVLGAPCAAHVARLTRAGLLEVLSQDYIRTARAKGLPPRTVLLRHALRAGVLPVVTYLGPASAAILTGSLVVEKIFAIPGAGTHFVNSALNRDYTLAMGVTLVYTVLVYALNVLVDLVYTLLDPRIALEEAA
jgi:oligopeptide transport system permease protein